MMIRPENWVFLGDSLTEGIGSGRVSYVTELAACLRAAGETDAAARPVHEFCLREVNPDRFNRFIRFNFAANWNRAKAAYGRPLWLWNLACEGKTVESDFEWLPLLENLRPDRVFIMRGALESIIRPMGVRDSVWQDWVPRSWRAYAAMDPRCYFSDAWYRKIKQVAIDRIKQRVRLDLLHRQSGAPLLETDVLMAHLKGFIRQVRALDSRIVLLGLLPVNATFFPGSPEQFSLVNASLRELAETEHTEFLDLAAGLAPKINQRDLFYRDGFHPNRAGACAIAEILSEYFRKAVAG